MFDMKSRSLSLNRGKQVFSFLQPLFYCPVFSFLHVVNLQLVGFTVVFLNVKVKNEIKSKEEEMSREAVKVCEIGTPEKIGEILINLSKKPTQRPCGAFDKSF